MNKTKSGIVRIIVLILFFLFLILYFLQITGYNEYNQNKKRMLTDAEIQEFEADVAAGKDVSMSDYLKSKEKDYDNVFSQVVLGISDGISDIFNKSMNAIFKMLGEAVTSS